MATKVMLGLPFEAYPETGLPANYICVKVPQFSFSRLSGADPVFGVEMASTGEVACFGKDNAGYNIFATSGTADLLQEHNVPCKGYHTRRMAVDFAVPLIANVKNAKMLAEALIRKLPLEIATIDSKSSHRTHSFPVLTNIAAFIPGLIQDKQNVTAVTEASVSAGFTTAMILPWDGKNSIVDRPSLEKAQANTSVAAASNYTLSFTASATNFQTLDEETFAEVKFLFVPGDASLSMSVVASRFASWPANKPVVSNTKGSDLASILFLASLHGRSVHVTDVRSSADLDLISLSKARQLKVTVEVVIGRRTPFFKRSSEWSPLDGKTVAGAIHRVVVDGNTIFLDGSLFSASGRDISSSHIAAAALAVARPSTPAVQDIEPSAVIMALPAPEQGPFVQVFSRGLPHTTFHRRHILSVEQFAQKDLCDLLSLVHEMRLQVERNGTLVILKGKVLCTLFYEPSSDERLLRCCDEEMSSVLKEETIPDTIRTLACYTDAIVMRHPDVGSPQLAAKFSPVPIINAGDGIGEHPTQALLDIYTIRSELGTVNGRTITLLGDLKNGRTVHSLVTQLSLYPASLAMPSSVVTAARKAGVPVTICESLDEVLADTDVLYVTRVQKERFASEAEWLQVKDAYRVDHAVLSRAKEDMIIMHPLPRVNGT
ncbi:hypothetical protein H0H92_013641 [Tricholoma furcatifolium]|nr:hypothetical protein H0H92_013641 [Tricholoma furcatifolium]